MNGLARAMAPNPASIFGIEISLGGKAWHWRGGNMDLGNGLEAGAAGLEDDIVTQLLLARGVPRDDVPRQRSPSLRAFLPDPSQFRDMDVAAERLAQAVLTDETITVYGDYDVDGATSAALFIRLLRMLGRDVHSTYGPTADTGGLMQNHAPTIYAYRDVLSLLEDLKLEAGKTALPGAGGKAVTERPAKPQAGN